MEVDRILMDGPLSVVALGNRLYRLSEDRRLTVVTDIGRMVFTAHRGFVSNYRSGGILVDAIVDQVGSESMAPVYWVHDMCYTPCASLGMAHPLSRRLSDGILRSGLLMAGMPPWKASLVYRSVRIFGRRAYDEDDFLTRDNSRLFGFSWEA